jgi:hypothetical protein
MTLYDEVTIDEEVKAALDGPVLSWPNTSTGQTHGGVSYQADGEPFAILLEGVLALRLPPELLTRGLTLAGVSPFRPPNEDREVDGWIQLVVLLAEDVPDLVPWAEAAYKYMTSTG